MKRARTSAGFTLVEVMVALAIFGLIAAAGVTILSFSVRAQAVTTRALDDLGAVERLGTLLTADLGQAVDRPTRDSSGALLPAFAGANAGTPLLRLTRGGWSNVDDNPRASLQKVEYRLDGGALLRTGYPALDGAAPLASATLIGQVGAVRLRFRIDGAWSDRWDAPAATPLPDAVELTLLAGAPRAQRSYRMLFLVGTGARAPATGAPPPPAQAPSGP